MKISREQIRSAFIEDSLASAIEAFDKRFPEIEGQIRQSLDDNDVKKVQHTVDLKLRVTVDKDQRRISPKGGVSATVKNIVEWCEAPEREIEDPDQGQLFDATTEKPEETED